MRPKTAVLNTTTIPSQISLTVKGLGLGTIVKRTQILQYRVIGDSKTENKSCITKQAVLTLMELITQDRWQPDTSVEGIATRTRDNLDTQLSEMASYVLSAIGDRKQDSYIALLTTILLAGAVKQHLHPQTGIPATFATAVISISAPNVTTLEKGVMNGVTNSKRQLWQVCGFHTTKSSSEH
jgi:hypothetical protein